MNEKQNNIVIVFILIIVIFSFLILTPKVSSILFPIKRQIILKTFINKVKQDKKIDSQKFWEFREFYSPGYFVFNKDGLNSSQIEMAESKTGVTVNVRYIDRIFLTFASAHLTSFEALVTTRNLSNIINIAKLDSKQTIFSNSNTLAYKDSEKRTHIIFLKSQSEMERANGFFDYSDAYKRLIQGKNWLEVTVLDEK